MTTYNVIFSRQVQRVYSTFTVRVQANSGEEAKELASKEKVNPGEGWLLNGATVAK